MTTIDIGINETNRIKIADGLKALLADSYTLYLQTHNFHWNEMIDLLTKGHEQVVRTSREVLKLAQDAEDESTAALVSDRMRIHEKTSWMLRATRK